MNTNLSYQELSELLEDMLETFELTPSFDPLKDPQFALQSVLNDDDDILF